MKNQSKRRLSARQLDKAFEKGDVTKYLDLKSVKVRPAIQRINIDMPQEILEKVDHEAARVGITRTSLLKLWIAERADQLAAQK